MKDETFEYILNLVKMEIIANGEVSVGTIALILPLFEHVGGDTNTLVTDLINDAVYDRNYNNSQINYYIAGIACERNNFRTIDSVREVRIKTGLGLKEAKALVDQYMLDNPKP